MRKRRLTNELKILTAAVMSIAVFIGLCACKKTEESYETIIVTPDSSRIVNHWKREGETSDTSDPSVTVVPGETSHTSGTALPAVIDLDYVKSIYVYSVWYDAVIDNPADYTTIDSDDAFALKGVFYFSSPLTAVFEARLYKDGAMLLKRDVKLRDNVTAECDFSAGLEWAGTFDSGEYYVELLYDGQPVATTSNMRVR